MLLSEAKKSLHFMIFFFISLKNGVDVYTFLTFSEIFNLCCMSCILLCFMSSFFELTPAI